MHRAEQALRAHLPDAVSKRIEAGLIDYINELRVCTILFIGFPYLKVGTHMFAQLSVEAVMIVCEEGHSWVHDLKGRCQHCIKLQ